MSGPFKMSGSQFLGKGNQSKSSAAPMYDSPAQKGENDKKEEVKTSRGKDGSITKSKGNKSSTYTETSRKKNRDGSTTIVRTNELGNTETRVESSPN